MKNKNILKQIYIFALLLLLVLNNQIKPVSISADNVCTFHIADKLFTLKYIQQDQPYQIKINNNSKILFNYCKSFLPDQCKVNSTTNNSTTQQLPQAFSFLIKSQGIIQINQTINQTYTTQKITCQRFSSNSYLYYFSTDYLKHNDQPQLIIKLNNPQNNASTSYHIFCSDQEYFKIKNYQYNETLKKISIYGESSYGCPVFQISSLWTTLEQHSFILGIILFILGFQMLFYGLLMINLTVFIAGYFISFAILGGIFTVFLGPNSSSIAVYFSLLFILLSSTLIAYGLTKLINISIFFIGAFFGLIVGALVNTLFCGLFSVTSIWSLVIFQVLFTIPFGILTLKYSNQLIIASTSLTGSYLIIRPISWLIGGFPNQFVLYELYASKQLTTIPWSFYLYLLLIIILAVMGAFYQYLKLQRQDPSNTIMTNIVTQNIEQPLDKIKAAVDKLIERYSSSQNGEQKYKKMKQMQYQTEYFEQVPIPMSKYQQISENNQKRKIRKSKDQSQFY